MKCKKRTAQDSKRRERIQDGYRRREAERLEQLRQQNAERQRRFQARKRAERLERYATESVEVES